MGLEGIALFLLHTRAHDSFTFVIGNNKSEITLFADQSSKVKLPGNKSEYAPLHISVEDDFIWKVYDDHCL